MQSSDFSFYFYTFLVLCMCWSLKEQQVGSMFPQLEWQLGSYTELTLSLKTVATCSSWEMVPLMRAHVHLHVPDSFTVAGKINRDRRSWSICSVSTNVTFYTSSVKDWEEWARKTEDRQEPSQKAQGGLLSVYREHPWVKLYNTSFFKIAHKQKMLSGEWKQLVVVMVYDL